MSIEVLKQLMTIPCIDDAGAIAGYSDAMRKTKVRELADRISTARQEGINDPQEVMKKVFTDLFNENKEAGDYRKAVQLNHAMKIDGIIKFVDENFPNYKDVAKGLRSQFFGSQEVSARGRGYSISNSVHSLKADYYGRLIKGLNDEGVLIDFQKRLHHDDFGKELWELGSTKNERANKMAKIVLNVYKDVVNEMRAHGIPVQDIKHFVASMTRDSSRIAEPYNSAFDNFMYKIKHPFNYEERMALSRERWTNFYKEHANHEETFKGMDPDKWLAEAHKHNTVWDSAKQQDIDSDTLAYGGLAARGAKSRVIIHKDADSFLKDIRTYGTGDVFDYVIDTIEKSAKYAGTAKYLGTRPSSVLRDSIEVLKKRKGVGENEKLVTKLNNLRRVMDEFTGKASIPESRMWNAVTNAIMNYQSMTKLGSSITVAFNDINYVAASILKNFDENAVSAYGSAFWNYIKHMKVGGTKDTLDQIGHWAGRDASFVHSRNGAVDSVAGLQSKLMGLTFKLNRIHWQDEVNYFGTIWNHMYRIGKLTDQPLATLRDSKAADFLRRYTVSDKEWELMRHNASEFEDGTKLVTPDDVFSYSDKDISKHLGINPKELTTAKSEQIKTDLRRKMISMYHDEGMYSFLAPDLAEKAILRLGAHARSGTPAGALTKALTQFQSWRFAELHRVFGTLVDPIKKAEGVGGKIMASKGLITYAVGRTITGYISEAARSIMAGEPIPDPTKWETWAKVGVAGTSMLGEIVVDLAKATNGEAWVEKLLGPTVNQGVKLADILNSTWKAATDENYKGHLGWKVLKFGESMTPYLNLFYINLAVKKMFLDAFEEAVDPSAKQREEHNKEKRQEKNGDINITSLFE